MTGIQGGSPSIDVPDYWWYQARSELLESVLSNHVHAGDRVLDVGSADGPSVGWLRQRGQVTSLDLDPRGLLPGGVCASALALPFADASFGVVAAFDVLEHLTPEGTAVSEFSRVLSPGGRLLISVPAYSWAWSNFDIENGHQRRYTRPRAIAAIESGGLSVDRSTYAFSSVFPFFVADRLRARAADRLKGRSDVSATGSGVVALPRLPAAVERMLLGLSRLDRVALRRTDLPFGSSVVVAATKPRQMGE